MERVKNLTSKNFDEFIKSGVSVVDFSADWCNPCKILNPIFHEVANEIRGVRFGVVDVDKEGNIAQRFGVMSVPTIIFFKKGNEKDVIVGALSKDELLKKIKENSK